MKRQLEAALAALNIFVLTACNAKTIEETSQTLETSETVLSSETTEPTMVLTETETQSDP